MPRALSRQSLLLVYLLALALLWGNAYFLLVNHPAAYTVDEQHYQRMAQGDFKVPVPHRYRVVVPLLAGGLAHGARGVANLISPADKPPFGFSFFLVNTLLLAGAGLVAFRTARAAGAAAGPALLGMAALLTCGAATSVTGLLLADSAVVLAVALLYYAIHARSAPALLTVLVLGPVLDEFFLLFLPLAVLYGGFVRWRPRLLALAGGLLLLVAVHWAVEANEAPTTLGNSISPTLDYSRSLVSNLNWRLLLRGLGAWAGVYGLFNLILLTGFWGGTASIGQWLRPLRPGPTLLLLLAVLALLLLSGETNRLVLAGPAVVVAVALVLDRHPLFGPLRQSVSSAAKPETE
ncbi:hypothetical protein [Hymenobacter cellulosivorans]|uniref:Glycosyltransferase RgtA/B/C/D-like domain-containing protein n=1 Tax=Hymenobacter cellulosivorans TaxID=2932249 RepID=A0ABY4FCN9_9BACT|nr:hypothetical protein [Hymenobacter cellulosivorans]UOQ54300.1 hypothetical protein MUN80_05960 [Hymenobacter cellulosivorans]